MHQHLASVLATEDINGEREVRALAYKKRRPLARRRELMAELEPTGKTLLNLHFHDLRHEATSRLAERLQMHKLMKVAGHKSSSMLSRYYHPRAEEPATKLD